MLTHAVFMALLQYHSPDGVRWMQLAEKTLKTRMQEECEARQGAAAAERRRFQERFNALVKAVELFGRKYNEGKGLLWPKREGDVLRKAISELRERPLFGKNRLDKSD